MDSSSPTDQFDRVIFPIRLGTASDFNRTIFPLYRRTDSLGLGDVYLEATLDELLKIPNISANPQQWQKIIATTKARYDQLMLRKAELEQRPKSKNPFRAIAYYRAARMFLAASKSLYSATKSRSEEIIRSHKRSLLSISAEDGQPANDDVSPDEDINGISVRVQHPLNDNTREQLLYVANAITSGSRGGSDSASETGTFLTDEYVLASESLVSLVDDSIKEASSNTTSEETFSQTIIQNIQNYFTFNGSIYAPHSTLSGTTSHFGGNQNSGAVTHTVIRPNDT